MKKWLEAALRLRPIRFVADVVGVYFGNHVSRSAAELAYFMVLTLFPIFICISAAPLMGLEAGASSLRSSWAAVR